jgi:hypothetical protein
VKLQRLCENLEAFSFQVADSTLYTIGYKPLEEAWEKMSGNYEAMRELAATAARIMVENSAMAAAQSGHL